MVIHRDGFGGKCRRCQRIRRRQRSQNGVRELR
jgi:hypothetical protein